MQKTKKMCIRDRDDIAQLVAALRRHVHGIGVVDVSRAEGLYIAGRLAQLEKMCIRDSFLFPPGNV